MRIMHKYSDILREIEVINTQLELTNNEIKYWYFGGKGDGGFGANASLIQVNRLTDSKNDLLDRLKELKRAKNRTEYLLSQFEGIEYKIAYMRIIEHKTHKEIANDLGYEEQTIRKKWSRMKRHKESTDVLV